MKTLILLVCGIAVCSPASCATTIDADNKYAWAANVGWTNWRANVADGAVICEYVCSGYVWSANCGWIHLGDGVPSNGIRYSNTSASDYGVNMEQYDSVAGDPRVSLRGYAYAPNIGWVVFESLGKPQISLLTGRFLGYAWSANCGWINLNDGVWRVETEVIQPGNDADSDGIPDAFEFEYTNPDSLAKLGYGSDVDGDGSSDFDEYIAGCSPVDGKSRMAITDFQLGKSYMLTWTSSPARLYRIRSSTSLQNGSWELELDHIVSDGSTTTRSLPLVSAARRFFRVEAFRPLEP